MIDLLAALIIALHSGVSVGAAISGVNLGTWIGAGVDAVQAAPDIIRGLRKLDPALERIAKDIRNSQARRTSRKWGDKKGYYRGYKVEQWYTVDSW